MQYLMFDGSDALSARGGHPFIEWTLLLQVLLHVLYL